MSENLENEFNEVIVTLAEKTIVIKTFVSDLSNILLNETMPNSEKINKIRLRYVKYQSIAPNEPSPDKSVPLISETDMKTVRSLMKRNISVYGPDPLSEIYEVFNKKMKETEQPVKLIADILNNDQLNDSDKVNEIIKTYTKFI